jgi:hypothetical protein
MYVIKNYNNLLLGFQRLFYLGFALVVFFLVAFVAKFFHSALLLVKVFVLVLLREALRGIIVRLEEELARESRERFR